MEAAYTRKTQSYLHSMPQHAKPLIILDAGHGGSDEGAKVHHFYEKKITLSTVLLLKKYLGDLGYRVILTRSRDVFIPLHRRVSIANKTRAVVFVSVHFNASHSKDAKGLEVFYYAGPEKERTEASKKLAAAVLANMVRTTEAETRGIKMGNFHVIRETQMPAVLVEGGFITNAEERMLLRDRAYLDKIAQGIAQGVDRYLKA